MDKEDILQLFLEEAFERTQELGNELMDLEKNPQGKEIIQTIFRCAHTLKGNSTTVYNTILDMDPDEVTLPHIDKIGKLTHAMENLIMEVRDNGFILTPSHIDLLFTTEEIIEQLLNYVETGSEDEVSVEDLHKRLKEAVQTSEPTVVAKPKPTASISSSSKKYQLLLNIDESFKHAFLSLIYRDIEEKFEEIIFEPTFDDLMNGNDFEEVFVTVLDDCEHETIVGFMTSIDNVDDAILLSGGNVANPVEPTLDIFVEPTIVSIEPSVEHPIMDDIRIEFTKEENEEPMLSNDVFIVENSNNQQEKQPKEEPKEESKIKTSANISANKTIKVDIARIDEVLKHVSNLVILKNKLLNSATELNANQLKDIQDTAEEISQTVEFLQDSVMNIRMTPLDYLFSHFPKDVRRIAKESGKKVNFESLGGETEIDKSLLDKLKDPLMHLIRNSVDHGIESEETRLQNGKEPTGNILLSAKHEQSMVVITIEDDGAGIDIDKVVKKAIERGVITEEKARATSQKELVNLIFHPGLSTAKTVTEISGRGVGMDVVRQKIAEDMKGQIEIETVRGKGTKTIIRLPLTLAIINAMLTKISGEVFAFPSSQVESVEEIHVNDIKYIANKEIYVLKERDIEVPIVRLDRFFQLKQNYEQRDTLNLLILKSGTKTIGATVDEFIGHEDIVLKTIGKYLGNVPGIGGCNVLGNGDISLIVDVHSILNNL